MLRGPTTQPHYAAGARTGGWGAELDSGSHAQLSANPSHSQDKSDKLCSSSRDTLGTRGLGQRSDSRSLIRASESFARAAVSKWQHGLSPTLQCQPASVTLRDCGTLNGY